MSYKGENKGLAHPSDRAAGLRPQPLRVFAEQHPLRGDWSKLADRLFEAPTDALGRVNLICTRIAIIMLGGLLAIYVETFL